MTSRVVARAVALGVCSLLVLACRASTHPATTSNASSSSSSQKPRNAIPARAPVAFGPRYFTPAQETKLAEGGKALLEIRVPKAWDLDAQPPSSSASERKRRDYALAASVADLVRVLGQISGAKFEVVRSGDFSSGIVLGTPRELGAVAPAEATEALRTSADGDGREAYWIRSEPHRIVVTGNNEYGLSHGIQSLLRHLGYRRLLQGKNWEIVPRKARLSLALHMSDRPAFLARSLAPLGGDANFATPTLSEDRSAWFRALFLEGASVRLNPSSAWQSLPRQSFGQKSGVVLFNEHPEYILGFGKSRARSGQPFSEEVQRARGGGDYKFDVSNPAVRELFLEDARRSLHSPQQDGAEEASISVGPSDGPGWYLEDLANPDWYRQLGYAAPRWTGSVSDHVFGLANFIADHISREFAGSSPRFSLYAYDAYHSPPGFDLHPNVRVYVVQGSCGTPGCGMRSLLGWRALTGAAPLQAMDYLSIWDWTRGEPPASTATTPEALRRHLWQEFYENGVRALKAEAQADMALNGLGYYLYSLGLWNPLADFGALRKEFLELAFANAAGTMDGYYRTLDPANVEMPSHSTWSRAVAALDSAGRQIHAAGNAAAERRIDELKTLWYYLYLKRKLDATPDDEQLRARFFELFFRQGESYALSFEGFSKELMRRFGSWKRGMTPRPWRGSLKDSGCPADPESHGYQACSRPEWLRRGYDRAEIDRWWPEVRSYFAPLTAERPAFSNDWVPVREARSLHPQQCFDVGTSFSARASADVWLYSFRGEPVELKLYDFPDKQPLTHYGVSVRDTAGGLVLSKPWSAQESSLPILLRAQVPRPGAYRVSVEHDLTSFRLKPAPGYPVALVATPGPGSRQHRWPTSAAVFYVPKQTPALDVDLRMASGTVHFVAPDGADSPLAVTGGALLVGATAHQALAPGVSGFARLVVDTRGAFDALQLLNAPNGFSHPEGYPMLPREVAVRDALTPATEPFPVDRIAVRIRNAETGGASQFEGVYAEVLEAPRVPSQFEGAPAASRTETSETAVYRHIERPSVYLVRAELSQSGSDAGADMDASADWFLLFDANAPRGERYVTKARRRADTLVYTDSNRRWMRGTGDWSKANWTDAPVQVEHLPCARVEQNRLAAPR